MLYSIDAAQKLNPLAAGGSWGKQRHFASVSVVSHNLPYACQPTTDTESRCFFDVTYTEHQQNKRRAEPLTWFCAFAFCVLPAEGTLSAPRHITRQWEYYTLPTLYPHLSTTTSYGGTSGLAPLNNCELSSKTASLVWWQMYQGCAYRGNRSTRHRQKMNGGRKPQSAPANSNIPLLLSYLGVRGVLCPSLTNKQTTEVQHG